jgi:dTDP-D-glucose 4,6-dehydratase
VTDEVVGAFSQAAPLFSEATVSDLYSPYPASKAASGYLVPAPG